MFVALTMCDASLSIYRYFRHSKTINFDKKSADIISPLVADTLLTTNLDICFQSIYSYQGKNSLFLRLTEVTVEILFDIAVKVILSKYVISCVSLCSCHIHMCQNLARGHMFVSFHVSYIDGLLLET